MCLGLVEQELDDLTLLAAELCVRDVAFCAHNPASTLGFFISLVLDAREKARFSDNPLATGEPGIRIHVGALW